jgi:hypothetical protein
MQETPKAETVSRTARPTGFEDKKYAHGRSPISCVRTLPVVGSRIRPAALRGGLACGPVKVPPQSLLRLFRCREASSAAEIQDKA